jgi:hypothetical protein
MISFELKEKIYQVIDGDISFEQLEEWLVPRLPELLILPNSTDSDVVSAIELGLAEMDDGIRTKDEFMALLQSVIQAQHTTLVTYHVPPFDSYRTGSLNQTVQPTLDFTVAVSVR